MDTEAQKEEIGGTKIKTIHLKKEKMGETMEKSRQSLKKVREDDFFRKKEERKRR